MHKFEIQAQSGVNSFRNCVIGTGNTEAEAWEDAYGPKPWTPYVKKSARNAWCVASTDFAFLGKEGE